MLTVGGPSASEILEGLQLDPTLLQKSAGSHSLLNFGGSPVIVGVGSGLASPGYTLIADEAVAGELWKVLTTQVLFSNTISSCVTSRNLKFSMVMRWKPYVCPASY